MKGTNTIYLIVSSIILAYILQIFVLYPFTAIAIGVPLGLLSRKYSAIGGFLIGFLSSLSLYLIYPINGVSKIAEIIGQLIGINPFLVILLYPLIYGTISLISALLFYYIVRVNK
ncbi:hypothetical protein J5U23_01941 [Saccharolobus shibatae B12]|uniref:Uncharacterized protein n=1 Tax=Saccharolobus shibatae (strain ATCC 51178 / DSM 5389 / JCM 8931 / NBRC 15437 / B12) TaxID=523848 RepID=A0A8F5GU63_SACSH|nr:hypothetical protein [Saccharolobus shibatae]QXJ29072.1 hypothetical protein J5U23_01941 [Saccharolobus shibatae B12]